MERLKPAPGFKLSAPFCFKVKPKEIVGHLGSRGATEDVHAVSGHRTCEVATGWRTFAALLHFFPELFGAVQRQLPHVVQSGLSIVPSKDPQFVVVDRTAMCRSWRRFLSTNLPLNPCGFQKLVLEQIVAISVKAIAPNISYWENKTAIITRTQTTSSNLTPPKMNMEFL